MPLNIDWTARDDGKLLPLFLTINPVWFFSRLDAAGSNIHERESNIDWVPNHTVPSPVDQGSSVFVAQHCKPAVHLLDRYPSVGL